MRVPSMRGTDGNAVEMQNPVARFRPAWRPDGHALQNAALLWPDVTGSTPGTSAPAARNAAARR